MAQLCPTLCNPMNHSTPGFPVHHQLLEFTQTHVHRVGDAIQPSQPLLSPSPPAPNPSQHTGLVARQHIGNHVWVALPARIWFVLIDESSILVKEKNYSLGMGYIIRIYWKFYTLILKIIPCYHGIQPNHFMVNRWGNNGNSELFSGLQNHCRWWLQPWN